MLPGDVIVRDAEGVVVIPAQVAEEVAHDSWDQERLEDYILEKVEAGSQLRAYTHPARSFAPNTMNKPGPDEAAESLFMLTPEARALLCAP